MPAHLKALVVVMILSFLSFAFVKRISGGSISTEDFDRRRNIWFLITLIVFLANDFWIYIVLVSIVVWSASRREHNIPALYLFILFAAPVYRKLLDGFGVVNLLIGIDYLRVLSLCLLLPSWLVYRTKKESESIVKSWPDRFVTAYVLYGLALVATESSATSVLRALTTSVLDILLPYYVLSRMVNTQKELRDVLMSFVVAAAVLAALAGFEASKGWLLYQGLQASLGVDATVFALARGDFVRAQGGLAQSIPLGYVMAIAVGFYLCLSHNVENRLLAAAGYGVLSIGLLAALSRGPWVGTVVLVLAYMALGQRPLFHLGKVLLFGAGGAIMVAMTPMGEKLLTLLPFIGETEAGSVTYRQQLVDILIPIIIDNPISGALASLSPEDIDALKQGQGIIDVVNTFLLVGLHSGVVGLALFAGVFAATGVEVFLAMRALANREDGNSKMGQSLLATLLGVMVIITTVSSISVIPYIYWALAGLGHAFSRIVASSETARVAIPDKTTYVHRLP